jgi:hypothetical protein
VNQAAAMKFTKPMFWRYSRRKKRYISPALILCLMPRFYSRSLRRQRGVDVRIILPSVTDSGLVFQAGQSFYDEMLANGIRIYELQIAVLHAKTAVIDGVWSTVGSTNIDTRSFLHNNEINIVVFDTEFAQTMESTFDEDLRYSVEMTKEKWATRPWSKSSKNGRPVDSSTGCKFTQYPWSPYTQKSSANNKAAMPATSTSGDADMAAYSSRFSRQPVRLTIAAVFSAGTDRIISTRRFSCLSCAVALPATGNASP